MRDACTRTTLAAGAIDVDDVARLIEVLRRDGRKAWTIRGNLTVAGRIFDFARRRLGWAGQNPVRLLDRSERPRSDQRERRVLSGEELERLIGAADDRYRPIFAFAAGTGARLGETLGLKWRSLDFERGTASITHQLDREGRYVELKTARSRRTVELPASLVSMLRARKLESPFSNRDDYVFASRTGRSLEHRNGDLVELSAHLGHRDPSITASTYSHEFEKASRSDARRARLDGMFGRALDAGADPGVAQLKPTGMNGSGDGARPNPPLHAPSTASANR